MAKHLKLDAWKKEILAGNLLYQETDLTRTQAYLWLAKQLGLHRKLTHIGMFGEETCDLVVELVPPFLEKLRQQTNLRK